jgi:hypothetical protein
MRVTKCHARYEACIWGGDRNCEGMRWRCEVSFDDLPERVGIRGFSIPRSAPYLRVLVRDEKRRPVLAGQDAPSLEHQDD